MTALKLENVQKSFGDIHVLKDIDLEVAEREFIVFVGPSGCGKSTLLRVIAGLEDASGGRVMIGGRDVTRTPPAKRGISMVFQSYALYPHLDVEGNMALGLRQAGEERKVIAERIATAASMLSLEPYLKRRPAELSGGQRQRVAIGRAIVRKPDLFLFDEPLSNLDAALRMATRVEIARLHRELGACMVYVTHDQTEAMTLADRIVVLRDGRIEQVGSPMELYNDPANQFVAGFLGSPSMNFLAAGPLGAPGEVLGIRPEHLGVVAQGPLRGRISHVERLGGDTNLLVTTPQDETVTVRLFGQHDHRMGTEIALDFDRARALSFDAAGKRLRP
ncbi:ABC transporter ATP-binding protein [Defluviimonas sp. WL0002]|uniref:ABC transporter ATP-binding protein n=1 Tax=Albidovulum marisflavi TaxID=2984159 RepID=A0ABT2ZFW2_9RHOB|nr:ABC transporter ATP-binding protein [Defluviimonas sp. WL0002]MCV2869996.1 ABC transporter ATP-binding protein [Defluviimonas sp. WL0002]